MSTIINRQTLETVDDLIKVLSNPELRGRPLCQVITVDLNLGGAGTDMEKHCFNQLDNFGWDVDNLELNIEI